MNFHSRSYSEQPQMGQTTVAPNVVTNGNGHQSFIRVHSDSQQSLDQLFNPTHTTVPLRSRNLPLSFFDPSVKSNISEGSSNGQLPNSGRPLSLHYRSTSFDYQNQLNRNPSCQQQRANFHTRTHSTIAPMPRLLSNDSSHQSSHEFVHQSITAGHEQTFSSSSTNLHEQSMHNHSHSNSAWSSAANSRDNLNSPGWLASQPSLSLNSSNQVSSRPQQPMQALQNCGSQIAQQPIMSPTNSHQNIVYSTNSIAQPNVAQSIPEPHHHDGCASNLHARSMSFNPQPGMQTQRSFHGGTLSTIVPISNSTLATTNHHTTSNHSLHRSSQELSYPSNNNNWSTTASSNCGYSNEDLDVGRSQAWLSGQNPQQSIIQRDPSVAVKPMQADKHDYHHEHHHHQNPYEYHSHHRHHHHHTQAQPQHQQSHQPHQVHQPLFYHA